MATVSRTVLVTGGNRGLGLAVAALMHARGHRVLVAAREEEAAGKTAAALGEGAVGVALDITDPDSVARAAAGTGPVDILVNNAGVQLDWGNTPSAIPLDLVEQTLAVNLLGSWRVAQAYVPAMVRRGWGRIVNVSSGTGTFTIGIAPQCPAYSVSKASLNALTVMLAKETEGTGVLVNAVNPGLVRTRMRPEAEQSPEVAAEAVAHAASLPDDGPSGVLFRRDSVVGW
ncbi:SDR family oxidoreductase [Streptomyces sp. NBC_01142]|uniref:SDR family NAD(P)-dependent oxidoreductase n=1 Tax=Streptomyces sp. NBC_01142 TaxID=2975865 RepID=UPI0022594C0C|nr:SDR family oxidoreductase [Streptomyces sp. NBC_01142]MCX4820550.1 SDR family oxidoreductase [Streptomyces sp. NBC_01142]